MNRNFRHAIAILIVLILAVSTFSISVPPALSAGTWTPGTLEIHTIDVGQGDATLIVSPEGKSMLIDVNAGSAARVASYIQGVLGHKNLDYVIVSHYHADHMGDYVTLLSQYGVTTTKTYDRGGSRTEYDSATYRAYYDYVTNPANNAYRTTLRDGDLIDMGPSLTVKVVSIGDVATGTANGITVVGENDNSVALKLIYRDFDYFVGGDLSGENYWNSAGGYGYADIETSAAAEVGSIEVYRVNHHGSSHSSNQTFVDTLKPSVSIISVGNNSYGHPDATVVSRLRVYGDLYQTESSTGQVIDGDVVTRTSDGINYTVEGRSYVTKPTTPPPGSGKDVKVNELLPAPQSTFTYEWIELYNPTSSDIDLSGYIIDDIRSGGSAAYTIPSGTVIRANGFFVWRTSNYFNNTGDTANFVAPDGAIIDSFTYTTIKYDRSYYRYPDGGAWSSTMDSTPTEGAANQ